MSPGSLFRYGLGMAAAALLIDQAFKLWMLFGFEIGLNQPVRIAPFLDLVLVWNEGISYGLFRQDSPLGQRLLVGVKLVVVALLLRWLWRSESLTGAAGLGLIIGGAIGNGIDRIVYGAVADFFYFHVGSFSWYVFNLADVAIVAGVGLLVYEAVTGRGRGDAQA